MAGPEGLREVGLTFFFEDGSKPRYVELVVQEVVHDRYVGGGGFRSSRNGRDNAFSFF